MVCSMHSYKPSRCDVPVRLLQLLPEDGEVDWPALGNTKLTVTSHDTDLASAENEEVTLGGNNKDRDRSWTYLPDCFNAVHECIFSVTTSGVICVLKLCYALRHVLMTCTCNRSMHISPHATAPCTFHHMQLLHAHFTTCNCSMHIQHLYSPHKLCSTFV